jgi:hypothetical protein
MNGLFTNANVASANNALMNDSVAGGGDGGDYDDLLKRRGREIELEAAERKNIQDRQMFNQLQEINQNYGDVKQAIDHIDPGSDTYAEDVANLPIGARAHPMFKDRLQEYDALNLVHQRNKAKEAAQVNTQRKANWNLVADNVKKYLPPSEANSVNQAMMSGQMDLDSFDKIYGGDIDYKKNAEDVKDMSVDAANLHQKSYAPVKDKFKRLSTAYVYQSQRKDDLEALEKLAADRNEVDGLKIFSIHDWRDLEALRESLPKAEKEYKDYKPIYDQATDDYNRANEEALVGQYNHSRNTFAPRLAMFSNAINEANKSNDPGKGKKINDLIAEARRFQEGLYSQMPAKLRTPSSGLATSQIEIPNNLPSGVRKRFLLSPNQKSYMLNGKFYINPLNPPAGEELSRLFTRDSVRDALSSGSNSAFTEIKKNITAAFPNDSEHPEYDGTDKKLMELLPLVAAGLPVDEDDVNVLPKKAKDYLNEIASRELYKSELQYDETSPDSLEKLLSP